MKPGNIFFNQRSTAKLGDFGVAHLLDLGQTQTGGLVGTLAYMSPEQITGARLTIAADLYALGVTLFEVLTGRLPFVGPDFVAQHLGETPPLVSSIADIHASWDPIVSRLLAKDPQERYPSIRDLRKDVLSAHDRAKPKPLSLPRANTQPTTPTTSEKLTKDGTTSPPPRTEESQSISLQDRYQYETPLGQTAISTISRAVDTVLNRSVILERYDTNLLDSETEQRIYALASAGGPFLQRSLAYGQSTGVLVYEAPTGVPLLEAFPDRPINTQVAAKLGIGFAHGLIALHESDNAHGNIEEDRVVIDESYNPTILVSGLGPVTAPKTPSDDITSLIAILCDLLAIPADFQHLLKTLDRSSVSSSSPANASQLYDLLLHAK